MKKIVLLNLLLLMMPLVTQSQTLIQKHEPTKVYFRQGSNTLDLRYMQNKEALDSLTSLLQPYVLDNSKVQGRVHITASASPEGGTATNQHLVETRAQRIADWISRTFQAKIGYELDQLGVDWSTLITLVEQSEVPHKAEVLDILRNAPEAERQHRIEQLHNGEAYQWMLVRLYPKLRYSAVETEIWYASEIRITTPSPIRMPAAGGDGIIAFEKNIEDKVVPTLACNAAWIGDIMATDKDITFRVAPNTSTEPRTAIINVTCYGKTYPVEVIQDGAEPVVEVVEEPQPEPEPVVVEEPACKNNLFMSISTNGLYDLALIPNIGAEIYLGKDWSIDANWHYAWWKTDKRHRYWRTYGGDLNIRKWFGKASKIKPLTGHHVGLYGQMITYDFELGGRGYLADRWSWAVGAEYGYSLPIARRLNLDFAIGIGYHWGKYDEYLPIDNCYVWQETNNRKYFGPTKAEVSLVWLIGCDNYNKQKGGKK